MVPSEYTVQVHKVFCKCHTVQVMSTL